MISVSVVVLADLCKTSQSRRDCFMKSISLPATQAFKFEFSMRRMAFLALRSIFSSRSFVCKERGNCFEEQACSRGANAIVRAG